MTAIQLGIWLKEYMEQKIVDGKMKTTKYPMILYNLSNWLGNNGCHAEALKMAEEGVDFCIKYGNLAFFPILLFNKGGALAELGETAESRRYLSQSVTIFEAMERNDLANIAIDWSKSHYQIEL